jgi:hypothetical protein
LRGRSVLWRMCFRTCSVESFPDSDRVWKTFRNPHPL